MNLVRQSAGHDGCGSCAEDQVEYEVGPVKVCVAGENIKPGFSDEADDIFAQKKTETDYDEHDGTDTEVHQVLHDDVTSIFRSGKSCLHHRETCLHPEHQCRTDQEPDAVDFT